MYSTHANSFTLSLKKNGYVIYEGLFYVETTSWTPSSLLDSSAQLILIQFSNSNEFTVD